MPLMLVQPLVTRLGLWPLRLLWLVLPLAVGRGVMLAVEGNSSNVQTTVEIGLWAAWFIGLVATLAPSTVTLTVLRIVAPGAVAAPLLAVLLADQRPPSTLIAVAYGFLVALLALLPSIGDPMINGSAYGSERRMALRPPASVLLGPVQLAWTAVFAGVITGPLLLASGRQFGGIAAVLIGLPAAFAASKSLHQLARRWIVFVPAGFVIHDYLSLAESILVQRRQKPTLGPAPTDLAGHLDLSGGALGLALTVGFTETVPVALRTNRTVESTTANRFVFTPSLPGELLSEARARAITIA